MTLVHTFNEKAIEESMTKEQLEYLNAHKEIIKIDEQVIQKSIVKIKELKEKLDKAREKTAMEIIEWIEGQGTVEYLNHGEPCEVYEVTPCDIEQLKEKYKGVGYELVCER